MVPLKPSIAEQQNLNMKKLNVALLSTLLVLFSLNGISQVGINPSGSSPHPSAMLDVSASDKGLLIPRVSLIAVGDNLNPINNPAQGLLVYNLNSTLNDGFYVWTGSSWSALATMDLVMHSLIDLDESAFGEMYEFHEIGSYTPIDLTNDGAWHGWGSGITGDTSLVFSDISGGIKRLNAETGGYYEVEFSGSIQAQSGNVVFDVALFKNDSIQNDLRARTECHEPAASESCTFSGIIELSAGDYLDVRFAGTQNKEIRLEFVNLSIRKIN